jgi:phospholipase C
MPTLCQGGVTFCPPVGTACPTLPTQCPVINTACPPFPTQCQIGDTQCPAVDTQCPAVETLLPLQGGVGGFQGIDHFIVIYQGGWSFDGLFGNFPGADGLSNAAPTIPQVDKAGNPLPILPNPSTNPPVLGGLPVQPFDLSQYVPPGDKTELLANRFYRQQLQIDNGVLEPGNGSMDKFVTWSDNGSLVQSWYDATNLPTGQLAQQYTLADNFFQAAYGGAFLNHQFLVAAAAPPWNQPIPAGFQSSWDPVTKTLKEYSLTLDGKYVVNTTYPAQAPHPAKPNPAKLLDPINNVDPTQPGYTPTIGDRLDEAGVSWKWYSGGWNDALAGSADPLFQYHQQPFAYYAKYAPLNPDGTLNPDTTGSAAHLQDENSFLSDLANHQLPAVCFIKPLGADDEHPGNADLLRGQQHVAGIVTAVQNSPEWANTAIIITYAENGGRWDHVVPPMTNNGWGNGPRVPTVIISPYAKQGFVDHTQYDTLSILKTIEERFGLPPLNEFDAKAASLVNSFLLPGEAPPPAAEMPDPDAEMQSSAVEMQRPGFGTRCPPVLGEGGIAPLPRSMRAQPGANSPYEVRRGPAKVPTWGKAVAAAPTWENPAIGAQARLGAPHERKKMD